MLFNFSELFDCTQDIQVLFEDKTQAREYTSHCYATLLESEMTVEQRDVDSLPFARNTALPNLIALGGQLWSRSGVEEECIGASNPTLKDLFDSPLRPSFRRILGDDEENEDENEDDEEEENEEYDIWLN